MKLIFKKYVWLQVCLLLATISPAQNLNVTLFSLPEFSSPLAEVSKLQFNEGNLVVHHVNGTNDVYLLSDVRKIHFDLLSSTDDLEIQNTPVHIYPNPVNDQLFITGLPVGLTSIKITGIDGRLAASFEVSGSEAVIPVSSLLPGIYVLHAHSVSLKIVKL